jgi:transmembrane protein EpsG
MSDLLVMILFCTAVAYLLGARPFACRLIIIIAVLFSGLRTGYNDTHSYMRGFAMLDTSDIRVSDLFQAYGGFYVFQKLIKIYISENPQALIFVSSIVTNILFVTFIADYAEDFCASVFLYLIGNYMFGMAGIKQAIAMAISIYSIHYFLEGKYVRSLLLLLLAVTFHPYIICIVSIVFLRDRVWSIKTISVIIASVMIFFNLERYLGLISILGKQYTMELLTYYTVNPFRILVESIPVIISLIYKNKINETEDEVLILGTNMMIISFVCTSFGLGGNPVYFARIGSYFTVLTAVSIPEMLWVSFDEVSLGSVFRIGYYFIFLVYFLLDLTKLGTVSLLDDQFQHISLFSLF